MFWKSYEIDRFLGRNQGLWLAEIELSSEQVVFEKPPWISTEVTTDHRYSNSYLSQHPFLYGQNLTSHKPFAPL